MSVYRTVSEIFSINKGVTLKPGVRVVLVYNKWCRLIDHFVPFSSYVTLNE